MKKAMSPCGLSIVILMELFSTATFAFGLSQITATFPAKESFAFLRSTSKSSPSLFA